MFENYKPKNATITQFGSYSLHAKLSYCDIWTSTNYALTYFIVGSDFLEKRLERR